jgi:shikimate kinase
MRGAGERSIVLVGAPGAGKSTVGRRLARRWGVDFHDSDQLVEAVTGKSVADIFVDDGEPAFRSLEREAIGQALDTTSGVLALGGGAVLDATTR